MTRADMELTMLQSINAHIISVIVIAARFTWPSIAQSQFSQTTVSWKVILKDLTFLRMASAEAVDLKRRNILLFNSCVSVILLP